MPRTAEGKALTERHRRAQLAIGAQALQTFTRIWPLWTGDERSFRDLVTATVPVVRAHHQLSSAVAGSYFRGFRQAEGAGGALNPRTVDVLPEGEIAGTLYVTGAEMTRNAILAGQRPETAMQTALVRTSGTVSRLSLRGGRETLVRSVASDREAQGWARVTSGSPCAFCALLASRGSAYSENGAAFEAHDHCSCSAEPVYAGSELPGRGEEFKDLYNRATREARQSGDLDRGTSNDLLNAFRRAVNQPQAG